MSTNQDTVDQLYPSTTGVQTEESGEPKQTTEEDQAIKELYPSEEPKTTGNPYSLDGESLENELYGAESTVSLSRGTDLSIIAPSETDQASLKENLGFMASESGAEQADIEAIVNHTNKMLTIGEKPDQVETYRTLYNQHGNDLTKKLDDAIALVDTFPELATWLEETQLGNDPVIINKIMRIAASPRSQARLTKIKNMRRSMK